MLARHFALFLLALNTIAIVIAIVVPLFLHQGHRAVERQTSWSVACLRD
jgi:hypothetical protein